MMIKAWPYIDLKALRMALSNVGISPPESDEMLAACLSENLTGLLLAINNQPNALMEMAHRALAAEAELSRRGALAGEPVGVIVAWNHPTEERQISFQWLRFDVKPGTKLYAAPPAPAVPLSVNFSETDDADNCRKLAWEEVKRLVGGEKWTVGDSCIYHGFYCWGWDMRRQYNEQRAPAVPGEIDRDKVPFRYSGPMQWEAYVAGWKGNRAAMLAPSAIEIVEPPAGVIMRPPFEKPEEDSEKVDVTNLALGAVAQKLAMEDGVASFAMVDGRTLQLRVEFVAKPATPIVRRCPRCGSTLVTTERRPGGNSTCGQGHVFPTASCIPSKD